MKNTVTKEGKVRANRVCPFVKRCSQIKADCPTRGNTKPTQHACGVARLFAAADARRAAQPKAVEAPVVVEQPQEVWNVAQAVENKRNERYAATTWIPQSAIAAYAK